MGRTVPPGGKSVAARSSGSGDVLRLRRAVALLVLLCGAAHLPLDRADTPRHGPAASLGLSAL